MNNMIIKSILEALLRNGGININSHYYDEEELHVLEVKHLITRDAETSSITVTVAGREY